jgi:hypothetical protein
MNLQKISTNCHRGLVITNIHQIYELSLDRKSVFIEYKGSCWGGIKPASWVISLQGRTLCELINRGQVYYCINKKDFDEQNRNVASTTS